MSLKIISNSFTTQVPKSWNEASSVRTTPNHTKLPGAAESFKLTPRWERKVISLGEKRNIFTYQQIPFAQGFNIIIPKRLKKNLIQMVSNSIPLRLCLFCCYALVYVIIPMKIPGSSRTNHSREKPTWECLLLSFRLLWNPSWESLLSPIPQTFVTSLVLEDSNVNP